MLRLEDALQKTKKQYAGERGQLVVAALESLKQLRSAFAVYALHKQHRIAAPPESVARGAHGGITARNRITRRLPISEAIDQAGYGEDLIEVLHMDVLRSKESGLVIEGGAVVNTDATGEPPEGEIDHFPPPPAASPRLSASSTERR